MRLKQENRLALLILAIVAAILFSAMLLYVVNVQSSGTVTVYNVREANWFFSPGNWYKSGTTYAQTNNPGAYMRLAFTGTGLSLGLDMSVFDALALAAAHYPRLRYSVDGGAWQDVLLTQGQTSATLTSRLSDTSHTVFVIWKGVMPNGDRWNTPSVQLRVTSVTIIGTTLTTPTLASERWIVFGDSITEGINALGDTYQGADQDASNTWALQVAANFNAELGTVGFSGQGYTVTVSRNNIDEFHTAGGARTWHELFNNQSRSFAGIDTVLVAHGANDSGAEASTVESNVEDFLVNFRTANASIRIYLLMPFGGFQRTAITNAFNDYQTVTRDINCFLIDISQVDAMLLEALDGDGTFATYSEDGLHPNQAGHDRIAELVIARIDATASGR
jgi:lysophospholipase L1-like esterase